MGNSRNKSDGSLHFSIRMPNACGAVHKLFAAFLESGEARADGGPGDAGRFAVSAESQGRGSGSMTFR